MAKAASREILPMLAIRRTTDDRCFGNWNGSVPARVPRWFAYPPSVGLRISRGFPRIRDTYFDMAFVWMETRSPSLEWHFKGDSNEPHFWLDGVELVDMSALPTRVSTWFAPDWVRVSVGLQLYRPDLEPDFDLWIDEVAIHPTRIGCRR
jgi:hypothetical protein